MKTLILAFLFLIVSNLFAQFDEPIVVEVIHGGSDRLGLQFVDKVKALISEAPQYKSS